MKARVQQLQAKIDLLESGQQGPASPPITNESSSQSPPSEVRRNDVLQRSNPISQSLPNASDGY